MNKYRVVYRLLSPNGHQHEKECLDIYAPTSEDVRQGMENELQRRMGNLYQWQIDVQQIEDEQLLLF